MGLSRSHLTQPVNIRAEAHDAEMTVPNTTQFVYQAHDLDKPEIVARILQADHAGKVMVFTRTKRAAQRLADDLEERGFSATSIHGDLSQVLREKALTKFREDRVKVLVATDVAARGIDVADITHVINYECPDDDKTYVHRIGRTGRAGAKGVAVTFVDWQDVTRWKVINKTLDLDHPEPPETYSTSPHLLEDLHIPSGTKGRLRDPKPREEAPRERPERKPREERPHRERTRRRLRNGEPVSAEDAPATTPAPAGRPPAPPDAAEQPAGRGPAPPVVAAVAAADAAGARMAQPRRPRRRSATPDARRTGSTGAASTPTPTWLRGADAPGSLPHQPVDRLTQQVGVPAVAGVFLDHVHEDPAERELLVTPPALHRQVQGGGALVGDGLGHDHARALDTLLPPAA